MVWALEAWTDPRELPAPSVKATADALRAHAAQLGALCRRAPPPRRADRGRLPPVKASPLGFPEPAPTAASRRLDAAGARPAAGQPDQDQPLREWRGPLRRGPRGPAQPRLPEAVGGADPRRALAAAGRDLPRPRRLAGRLDLGAGAARRAGGGGGQGATRSRRGRHAGGVDAAGERLRARPERDAGGRLAVQRHRSATRPGLLVLVRRWMEAGRARQFCCTIKFQGETDHAIAPNSPPSPARWSSTARTTSMRLMFVRLG